MGRQLVSRFRGAASILFHAAVSFLIDLSLSAESRESGVKIHVSAVRTAIRALDTLAPIRSMVAKSAILKPKRAPVIQNGRIAENWEAAILLRIYIQSHYSRCDDRSSDKN
jgi:hypothetical protein